MNIEHSTLVFKFLFFIRKGNNVCVKKRINLYQRKRERISKLGKLLAYSKYRVNLVTLKNRKRFEKNIDSEKKRNII